MARTKVTPRKGEEGRTKVLKTCVVVCEERRVKKPSSPVHPPSPAPQTPQGAEEIMRRIAEVEWLEGVGRSPLSSLTQQLAQMAVEVGPSTWGGEEPARKKL